MNFFNEVMKWAYLFKPIARSYRLPASLIAAMIHVESHGDQFALNASSGAKGLLQVMDFHFKEGENPYDPELNLNRGVAYLDYCLNHLNNDYILALAAYNAGLQAVINSDKQIPPYAETHDYIQLVTEAIPQYLLLDLEDIYIDSNPRTLSHSPLFGTWRDAYSNVLGVADDLTDRIRRFKKENADISTSDTS